MKRARDEGQLKRRQEGKSGGFSRIKGLWRISLEKDDLRFSRFFLRGGRVGLFGSPRHHGAAFSWGNKGRRAGRNGHGASDIS